MEKTVFAIKPPSDLTTKYVLMVYKPSSGPLGGGGGGPSVFGIDTLERDANQFVGMEGIANTQVVCRFPDTASYLMIASRLIKPMTPLEAETAAKAEQEELQKLYDDGKPKDTDSSNDTHSTGNYL